MIIKTAIKWSKQKFTTFCDIWGEVGIPYTHLSRQYPENDGIRLFDLAKLHLVDHGYYVRLCRNANMIIVYNNFWSYLIHNSHGLFFEIGRKNKQDNFDSIMTFHFTNRMIPKSRIWHPTHPRIVCDVIDPYGLDYILNETKKHYKS